MTKLFIGASLIILIVVAGYVMWPQIVFGPTDSLLPVYDSNSSGDFQLVDRVFLTDLEVPWEVFDLGDAILVTERPGRLVLIEAGDVRVIYDNAEQLADSAEGGLLGMTLHPQFNNNRYLYIYETYDSNADVTKNRVLRFTLSDDLQSIEQATIIVDDIPGAMYHDGGRIAFGPDHKLYVTTGDATQPELAQDLGSLAGKILRLNDDGSVPADNPFSNSLVFSYGHRNPQGMAWDHRGVMYSSEHGPSGLESGQDEINRIIAGGNYGWPYWSGTERPGPDEDSPIPNPQWPVAASGSEDTWAPASLTVWRGNLWFAGLRGQALYQFEVESGRITRHLVEDFGRLRTTSIAADGSLLITTSNRDGRGSPNDQDDRVIKYDLITTTAQ